MRFEGILKEYLEAVATGFNRSGCRRFIHPKRGGATATAVRSKSVPLGPVSGLFPVHATGPLNTKGNYLSHSWTNGWENEAGWRDIE